MMKGPERGRYPRITATRNWYRTSDQKHFQIRMQDKTTYNKLQPFE
jgi:hypothetical protein